MNEQSKQLTAEEMWILSHQYAYLSQDCGVAESALTHIPHVMEDYAAQQTAALREELAEANEAKFSAICQHQQADIELQRVKYKLERLEAVKKELQYKSENLTEALKQIAHYENRLEAVKKERDQWHETYQNEHINLLEVTHQRDECKDILIEIKESAITHETTDRAITNLLSRISCGETKPVETYHIYHYLAFENPPNPEENVLWYRMGEPPYSGSMLDTDFPGLDYFYAWTLIPAPPETSK